MTLVNNIEILETTVLAVWVRKRSKRKLHVGHLFIPLNILKMEILLYLMSAQVEGADEKISDRQC